MRDLPGSAFVNASGMRMWTLETLNGSERALFSRQRLQKENFEASGGSLPLYYSGYGS